jgi:hypothetical protein
MPTHKLFQRPIITPHLTHESSAAFALRGPFSAPILIAQLSLKVQSQQTNTANAIHIDVGMKNSKR